MDKNPQGKRPLMHCQQLKMCIFCRLNKVNQTENKLSSARALHAELGAGLVRVHVHVHSRVARYKVGGYLKWKLHA